MKNRARRLSIGVIAGFMVLTGVIWLLGKTLGDSQSPTLYAGNPLEYWQQQVNGKDAGASNAAMAVVNSQVIPQLLDTMFHDTNDSSLRLSLINILNGLPGIQINYTDHVIRNELAAHGCERMKTENSVRRSRLHHAAIVAEGKL